MGELSPVQRRLCPGADLPGTARRETADELDPEYDELGLQAADPEVWNSAYLWCWGSGLKPW